MTLNKTSRYALLTCMTLSMAVATLNAKVAHADPIDSLSKTQENKQQLKKVESKIQKVQDELAKTNNQISDAMKKQEYLQAKIVSNRTSMKKTEKDLKEAEESFEASKALAAQSARSLQLQDGSMEMNVFATIFSGENLGEIMSNLFSIRTLVNAQNDSIQTLNEKMEKFEKNKQILKDTAKELEEDSNELDATVENLKKIKEESKDKIASLEAELEELNATIKADEETKVADYAQILAQVTANGGKFDKSKEKEVNDLLSLVREEISGGTSEVTIELPKETKAPVVSAPNQTTERRQSSAPVVSTPTESPQQSAPTQPKPVAPVENKAPERQVEEVVNQPVNDNTTKRLKIIEEAFKYTGIPYVWGGKTPSGFDCSGFTSWVYLHAIGYDMYSYTVSQEAHGREISFGELQPGDLLFWGDRGASYHVAIYIGNGQYIHAPTTGDVVKVGSMSTWAPSFARAIL